MSRDITSIDTLSKLAVTNRSAWVQFKQDLDARRNTVIKNLISMTEFGDLRMVQGRLAEIDALRALAAQVDNHLEGA